MNNPTYFSAVIHVDRDAALLAGLDEYGPKTIPVTPSALTDRQRQALVELNYKITPQHVRKPIVGNERLEDLLDVAADVLDAKRDADVREEVACFERMIGKLLSAPLADGLSVDAKTGIPTVHSEPGALVKLIGDPDEVRRDWQGLWGIWEGRAAGSHPRAVELRRLVLAHPDVAALITRAETCANLLQETLDQAKTLRKQRMAEIVAREEQEAAAAKIRRKAQLAAFVAEHMTPLQQRRLEAGLMATAEIIEAIADQAFAHAAHFETFDCIRRADVAAYTAALGWEFDSDEGISVGQRKADTLTDIEFEQLEGLTALFPGATVEAIEHYGYMDSLTDASDPELTVNVARVKLMVGDVQVMRDFVLDRGEGNVDRTAE